MVCPSAAFMSCSITIISASSTLTIALQVCATVIKFPFFATIIAIVASTLAKATTFATTFTAEVTVAIAIIALLVQAGMKLVIH